MSEFLVKIGPTPEILDSGNPPKIPKNEGGRGPPENPEKWGGTPPEFPGGTPPKNLQKWPKNGQKWPFLAKKGQKMAKNGGFWGEKKGQKWPKIVIFRKSEAKDYWAVRTTHTRS